MPTFTRRSAEAGHQRADGAGNTDSGASDGIGPRNRTSQPRITLQAYVFPVAV